MWNVELCRIGRHIAGRLEGALSDSSESCNVLMLFLIRRRGKETELPYVYHSEWRLAMTHPLCCLHVYVPARVCTKSNDLLLCTPLRLFKLYRFQHRNTDSVLLKQTVLILYCSNK